ncbi:hypothetical protein [Solibacillus sp. FSL K6-1523]|uniref:hypothetical protein n=1 Tax=Solibacillus sp. FSL K6-1523 TaxID=2921471 RepID=UPI0030F78CF1
MDEEIINDEEVNVDEEIIIDGEMPISEENSVLGGLIGDTFKLFFSDHNVIAAIFISTVVVALLIIAMKFLRGRW